MQTELDLYKQRLDSVKALAAESSTEQELRTKLSDANIDFEYINWNDDDENRAAFEELEYLADALGHFKTQSGAIATVSF